TSGCGLADHLSEGRQLADHMAAPSSRTMLVPIISLYFPCAKLPRVESGRVGLPNIVGIWFDQWPFSKKDSPFQAATDLYDFHRVAHEKWIAFYTARRVVPGFRRVDAVLQTSA